MNTITKIQTLIAVLGIVVLALLVAMQVTSANNGEVCDRTSQVRDAIVAASGAANCSEVSKDHLLEVTSLDLSNQDISSLNADDFNGLVRLEILDLSHNSLTTLPVGVFNDLYLLRTLYLNNNLLATLAMDVFDELFLLAELTLNANPSFELPTGMFDDFSRFDGMQSNGELSSDAGNYPHIDRFLTKHSITTPEEFIAALPPLYKERFTIVFQSEAAAKDHVSTDHPRIISFGADGRFTFAWNTDSDAPSKFRNSVEFLRQNDEEWSVGIIDFSGDSPSITEPASCAVCHGSLNKPLWGKWYRWLGTESPFYSSDEEIEPATLGMQQMLESSDPRINSLDFSASIFHQGEYYRRFLKSPDREAYVFAAGEAGSLWSWRHAEVLYHRLKTGKGYFRQYAQDLTCANHVEALSSMFNEEFDQREHNLFVSANIDESMIGEDGLLKGDSLVRHSYHYQADGSIAEALSFLALVELWRQEPIVRKLYRETSNTATISSHVHDAYRDSMLYYGDGEATAEDELIQKVRLHFGYGSRAALDARASQNEVLIEGVVKSAAFWDGHTEVMRTHVCEALTNGKPGDVLTSQDGGNVVVTWSAPTYDAESVTGYQILRSVNGAVPSPLIADTGNTDTSYADENSPAGDLVYEVRAIFDDYYLGPASIRPNIRATGAPGIVGTAQVGSELTADTSDIGDADGLTTVSYSYQWVADDSEIAEAETKAHTLTDTQEGKTIKMIVSFTDDRGNEESLTSAATASVAPPANSPATGSPTISGTPQVGKTLTADAYGIADEDGLSNATFTYQWMADDVDISGATGASDTLTDSEEGKAVKVAVSFTDDRGNEESLTSAATASVAPYANSPATGSPTISGTPQVGETLTADTSGIADEDGLSNASLAYQWIGNDGTTDSDIQDATGSTYTLVSDDSGKAIKVRVSFTDDAGNAETLTSPPLDPARPYGLTATASGRTVVLNWKPPAVFPYLYDYQILRNRPELGETEPLVYVDTGIDETTYTDTDVEPGVLYVYRVKAANFFTRLSKASEPVEIRTPSWTPVENSPATGVPTISGTAQVRQTLTADTSGITDADGQGKATFTYRWLADDTDISGATGSTYTLTGSDAGKAGGARGFRCTGRLSVIRDDRRVQIPDRSSYK